MKKLLATLLASTMALSAIGGLVACGESEKEPEKIAATGIALTNVYGQPVTEVSIAPDGSLGVLAKLTPATANSEVSWTINGTSNISVNPGGLNNTQAFLFCNDYNPTEEVTLTATVDGKKVTIPVNVSDWTRFMLVGNHNSWNAEDASEEWLFTQDATDKHLWTFEMNIPNVLPDGGVKVVAAARNETTGKITGLGWNGGYNLGINSNNPDEWNDEELEKPESERRELKKQVIDSTSGTLNIFNDGGSGNINIKDATYAGKYRFILKTQKGGAFDSLTYERIGDAE